MHISAIDLAEPNQTVTLHVQTQMSQSAVNASGVASGNPATVDIVTRPGFLDWLYAPGTLFVMAPYGFRVAVDNGVPPATAQCPFDVRVNLF